MRRALLVLALALAPAAAHAPAAAYGQTPPAPAATPPIVFLDCRGDACDSAHFRNEIRFVDWARHRADADVHLLITSEGTGSGGQRYILALLGRGRFAGDSSEIRFTTPQQATEAEARDALTGRIAQSLLRFAVQTTAADRIRVALVDEEDAPPTQDRVRDPWNFWVFSAQVSAELSGESRETQREFELSLSANRVTELWKIEFEVEGSYEENEFQLTDRTARSFRRDYQASASAVRAIAPLWSVGAGNEVGTSSFANQDLFARAAAVLEYSFYPYAEFSRRRLTLQYSVGVRYFDYEEITIYDRLTEQRLNHELELTLQHRQPWGFAQAELSAASYLHDLRRYSLGSELNLNVRLIRGLSVDLGGSYARVRDQIYIPKGDATDEEVLLRRRALETGYRYHTYAGVRFTFGSIYNNVVNPRMN